MATIRRTEIEPDIDYVDETQGRKIFDDLTREILGMCSTDFVRRYHEGTLGDHDDIDVARVVMMMPLFGDASRAGING